tara:strand:+ start:22045 stop:22377 length:333 start_codon:yes stop_codon:yes gene_type:complete
MTFASSKTYLKKRAVRLVPKILLFNNGVVASQEFEVHQFPLVAEQEAGERVGRCISHTFLLSRGRISNPAPLGIIVAASSGPSNTAFRSIRPYRSEHINHIKQHLVLPWR